MKVSCFRRSRLGASLVVAFALSGSFARALAAEAAEAASGGSRAIGVVPLAQSNPDKYAAQRSQSYGVFVGVDQFPSDSTIVSLKYAAADAQSMRECFVGELGYLPPENTRLLITGATGEDAPTRSNILKAIKLAADSAGPNGCLVVDLSTHGIEGYVLAEDSQRAILEDSAIPLQRVEDYLNGSRSPRRLLFFDACREKVANDGQRALSGGMSEQFAKAFSTAEGFAVLMSCDQGQFSYEMPEQGHGAFTYFLMQGLRGGAPAGPDGLITASSLSKWVKQQVEEWSRTQPGGKQSPRFDLREATGDLPLAVSRAYLDQLARQKQELIQAAQTLSQMFADGKLTAEQHALAQKALASKDSNRQQAALDVANGKLRPQYIDQLLQETPSAATPSPTPALATPAAAAAPSNKPPIIESINLTQETIQAGEDVLFEVVASDPDGDAIAKYCYRLNGQSSDSESSSPQIRMSKLKAGPRTLTVRAEDARGGRSEPSSLEFTVEAAGAPPAVVSTPAAPVKPTPETAVAAAPAFEGVWRLDVEKTSDSVGRDCLAFYEQLFRDQGMPLDQVAAQAGVDLQQFRATIRQNFVNQIVTANAQGTVAISREGGKWSLVNRNPALPTGVETYAPTLSSDGKRLSYTNSEGAKIALELSSKNVMKCHYALSPALSAAYFSNQFYQFRVTKGLEFNGYYARSE
ncbi:MAG: caspase family protein [Candidatus Sumerlaeota bacterium]|nr:caspase family protein [Candidatus Sumerlaeota bacterium]